MSALTVYDLAKAKCLPEGFLRDLGLRDTASGIAIPYRDESGNMLFERTRLSLDGGRRFLQPSGVSLAPYGLDRLKASPESACTSSEQMGQRRAENKRELSHWVEVQATASS